MKKIIKKGYSKFRTNCHVCGCYFEYEINDLIEDKQYIICPQCTSKNLHFVHNHIIVNEDNE